MEEIKEILLIVVPILAGLFTAGIQRWYLAYKTKKFQLLDHPIFTDLTYSIQDLDSWRVKENRQVFIDALSIKLRLWRDKGLELAEELQKNNFSNIQLKNKVICWATKVMSEYTHEWRKIGIPEKVITRITESYEIKVKQFVDEIKDISYNNDMYPFKMQKSIGIFTTLRLLLADTKNDFNNLVYRDTYNGFFVGSYYKNIPVSDVEYETYLTTIKK